MKECPNHRIALELESTIDRLNESAWYIRQMENCYHNADQFRWSLNSFLKSIKEVTQILLMETQSSDKELRKLINIKRNNLSNDKLISYLSKQRDIIVHKKMLKPNSYGYIGIFRGKTPKLNVGFPIDPLLDSIDAIKQFLSVVAKSNDETNFLYMLKDEEDGSFEYTGIQREWRLSSFPDKDILEICATAWNTIAEIVHDIAMSKGANIEKPIFELNNLEDTQIEIYAPKWVSEQLKLTKEY